MNDVHYYLSEWIPKNIEEKDVFFCSGINFFACPGRFQLGFNEGDYHIDGEGLVKMKTRGTSLMYCHPLVSLVNPDQNVYLGWTTIVRSFGLSKNFKVYKHAPTGFSTDKSIQTNYLYDILEPSRDLRSLNNAMKNAFPAWGNEELTKFIECLRRQMQKTLLTDDQRIEVLSYLKPTNVSLQETAYSKRSQIKWVNRLLESVVGPKTQQRSMRLVHPLKTDLTLSRDQIKLRLQERERDFLNDRGILNFTKWLWPVSPRVEHVEYKPLRRQFLQQQDEYIENHVNANVSDVQRLQVQHGIQTMMLFSGRKEESKEEQELSSPSSAAKLHMHIARSYPFAQQNARDLDQLIAKKISDSQPSLLRNSVSNARRGMELLAQEMTGYQSEDIGKILGAYMTEVKRFKGKKIKIKRDVDPSMTLLATDYYHVKDFDEEELINYNPHVIADGERYQGQMEMAIRWAREDLEIMAIHKNKKVPLDGLNRKKLATVSGSEVRNSSTGSKVLCFEYSNKAVLNKMRAIQRHLSAK